MKSDKRTKIMKWIGPLKSTVSSAWTRIKNYNASIVEYYDYKNRIESDPREKYRYFERGIR